MSTDALGVKVFRSLPRRGPTDAWRRAVGPPLSNAKRVRSLNGMQTFSGAAVSAGFRQKKSLREVRIGASDHLSNQTAKSTERSKRFQKWHNFFPLCLNRLLSDSLDAFA